MFHNSRLWICCVFMSACAAMTAHAKPYGNYDPKRLISLNETATGGGFTFDPAYFDLMLGDLAEHAGNYPPQFDSPLDRQRAIVDVNSLSGFLEIANRTDQPNPELLLRAAYVHTLGHNLGIADSADKANRLFQKLLTLVPEDPRANYMYGVFLSGVGKMPEALPFLLKAQSKGSVEASYTLGLTLLVLGDRTQSLLHLEEYRTKRPNDPNISPLIEAIRNNKIEIRAAGPANTAAPSAPAAAQTTAPSATPVNLPPTPASR